MGTKKRRRFASGELWTHHPRMGVAVLESCWGVTTENRQMHELRRWPALWGNLLEYRYCLPRNGSKILARVEQTLSRCVPA